MKKDSKKENQNNKIITVSKKKKIEKGKEPIIVEPKLLR
jgi:hypothetical protein